MAGKSAIHASTLTPQAAERKPARRNSERAIPIAESIIVDAVIALDNASRALSTVNRVRAAIVADANLRIRSRSAA